jgi:hypothetical protein
MEPGDLTDVKEVCLKSQIAALVVGIAAATGLFMGGGMASAHPVGDATEPNCHGQRVSHGASHSKVHEGHGDLEFGGGTPPERRDIVEGFINEDITVGEWHMFIKTCPAPGEPPA